jgi:hypothetical protein
MTATNAHPGQLAGQCVEDRYYTGDRPVSDKDEEGNWIFDRCSGVWFSGTSMLSGEANGAANASTSSLANGCANAANIPGTASVYKRRTFPFDSALSSATRLLSR